MNIDTKNITKNEFHIYTKTKTLEEFSCLITGAFYEISLSSFINLESNEEIKEFSDFLLTHYSTEELACFFMSNFDNLVFYFYMIDNNMIDTFEIKKIIKNKDNEVFNHISESSFDLEKNIFNFKYFYKNKTINNERNEKGSDYFKKIFFQHKDIYKCSFDFLFYRGNVINKTESEDQIIKRGYSEDITNFSLFNLDKSVILHINENDKTSLSKFLFFFKYSFLQNSFYIKQIPFLLALDKNIAKENKKNKENKNNGLISDVSFLNIFDILIEMDKDKYATEVFFDYFEDFDIENNSLSIDVEKEYKSLSSFFSEECSDLIDDISFFASLPELVDNIDTIKLISSDEKYNNFFDFFFLNYDHLILPFALLMNNHNSKGTESFLKILSLISKRKKIKNIDIPKAKYFKIGEFLLELFDIDSNICYYFLKNIFKNNIDFNILLEDYNKKEQKPDLLEFLFSEYSFLFNSNEYKIEFSFINDYIIYNNVKYQIKKDILLENQRKMISLFLNKSKGALFYNYKLYEDSSLKLFFLENTIKLAEEFQLNIKSDNRVFFSLPLSSEEFHFIKKYKGVNYYNLEVFGFSKNNDEFFHLLKIEDYNLLKSKINSDILNLILKSDYIEYTKDGYLTDETKELLILNNLQ